MAYVVLGLGSNRAYGGREPVQLLAAACASLSRILGGMDCSSVYRTGALYVTAQDDFLNMVAGGCYDGSPRELLQEIHAVESGFGRDRDREFRNGPRPLDIDIELFGTLSVREPDLVIPHERMMERAFVLVPLLELLGRNADVDTGSLGRYRAALESLGGQKIEKLMGRAEFLRTVPPS
ncbi:MAG: 2-amino-4-hydroxy-6-hydroxymethyldihydropteridine diphosphokinase [Treponema sp.]|jgi:2-amino-4-hydroxy-6-hydroxymethyldihydropteridine diphosphokinase|nr:2-amino-4-hydroxy-6-hydroxymethyldihydropteridine diphosphokinase [Treponema sp.]